MQVKPDALKEYMDIHKNVWPSVLDALRRHHIIDYSIHYWPAPDFHLLIANMKYTGDNYEEDMAGIAADPETQRWWKVTDGMQESFNAGATGSGREIPWWTVSGDACCCTRPLLKYKTVLGARRSI
jgi:L-rhamnose mutarotase